MTESKKPQGYCTWGFAESHIGLFFQRRRLILHTG